MVRADSWACWQGTMISASLTKVGEGGIPTDNRLRLVQLSHKIGEYYSLLVTKTESYNVRSHPITFAKPVDR